MSGSGGATTCGSEGNGHRAGASHDGGPRRQGVNRLAAGLDRGREQDGAVSLQRQARPLAARRFPPGPNRPVGEGHDPTGEPAAGKPHGGFGERGAETQPCEGLRHRHDAAASRESGRRTATPPRYSRRAAPRLYLIGLNEKALAVQLAGPSPDAKLGGTRQDGIDNTDASSTWRTTVGATPETISTLARGRMQRHRAVLRLGVSSSATKRSNPLPLSAWAATSRGLSCCLPTGPSSLQLLLPSNVF